MDPRGGFVPALGQDQRRSYMQKTVKMTLKGITFKKWASGQNIYEFDKEINPRGYFDPVLGLYTCTGI